MNQHKRPKRKTVYLQKLIRHMNVYADAMMHYEGEKGESPAFNSSKKDHSSCV